MRLLVLLLALTAVAPARASNDFMWAPRGAREQDWHIEAGRWSGTGGDLVSEDAGDNVLSSFTCPDFDEGTLTASITPERRQGPGGWAAAGIALFQDMYNYWRLALVESPDGQRYGELVEMLDGVWQAQSLPATFLQPQRGEQEPWEYRRTYELVISISKGSIRGQILDAAAGKTIFSSSYPMDGDVEVVASGCMALSAVGMKAQFKEMDAKGKKMTLPPRGLRSAAVVTGLPGTTPAVADRMAQVVKTCGLRAAVIAADSLSSALRSGRFHLLVLPWARAFPALARRPLLRFLRGGGRLLVLGPPPFENWVFQQNGRWVSAQNLISSVRAANLLVDFTREDLSKWFRGTDNPTTRADRDVVESPHGLAMCVRIDRLTGWDILGRTFEGPFPRGHFLTCFWAKGGRSTSGMIVEWREKDGSRWIATVPLTEEWKHYSLAPSGFPFWRDGSPGTRGGKGDYLKPENAEFLSFGLAASHLGSTGGSQEYSIASVGTAPDPTAGADTTPLPLEAISPWDKVYQTSAASVRFWKNQRMWHSRPHVWHGGPTTVVCCVPRTRSATFERRPPGRWIPFMEAVGSDGMPRGACGWCYFPVSGPYRGAGWACIGLPAPSPSPALREQIATALEVLLRDALFVRAGSRHWSYFEGEKVDIGAEIANLADRPRKLELRWVVTAAGKKVLSGSVPVNLGPGESALAPSEPPVLPIYRDQGGPAPRRGTLKDPSSRGPEREGPRPPKSSASLQAGVYAVTLQLLSRGKVIDSVAHGFRVLVPQSIPKSFVKVKDGRFVFEGKEWHPHGVNYWPSYVAGMEAAHYWGHWLSPAFYDPGTVEKDLSLLERLGVNAVSVQCNAVDQLRGLNDFLARARAHGILANVFIAGAHPLYPDERLVADLIRKGRLADNEAIFAYDIAWEPALGRYEQRRNWNGDWNRWLLEQYGSLDNAVEQWAFKPPMRDGLADSPTDDQLVTDGPSRIMVAAYRRFADDLISRRYGRITRLIRKLDPNHLIGARTGYGGTGQRGVVPAFPFDLVSGAKHFDFVSPEGWGLSGPWTDFRSAGFTTAYGRWASAGKPVFWAEFGATIYPGTSRRKIAEQGRIYQHMYRMILESGADGSAGWWFPGGLRVDENSDYGIVNPDGTLRPAAIALQAFGPRIRAPRKERDKVRILIDRDLHPGGYWMVWERAKEQYLRAVREGKGVEVVTGGTGTTTADMPIVAVGNRPYRRSNPLKYANAEFNFLRIKNASGEWQDVEDGSVVEVKAGKDVMAWASVGNTGEAMWLAGNSAQPGAVYLSLKGKDLDVTRALANDVPRYGDSEFAAFDIGQVTEEREISVRMEVSGLGRFGEERRVRLIPVK